MNFITKWFKKPTITPRATIIPTDLEEAVRELHSAFKPNEKREFANFSPIDPGLSLHLTGGMAMRNNWRMWEPDTPLSSWFRTHGIWHPDDMSAIIYKAFWCSLNGVPLDLAKEVKFFTSYWEKKGIGFDGIPIKKEQKKLEKREHGKNINTQELNNLIRKQQMRVSVEPINDKD